MDTINGLDSKGCAPFVYKVHLPETDFQSTSIMENMDKSKRSILGAGIWVGHNLLESTFD